MTKHREIKLEIARLMDSPEWLFLSEEDINCLNQLSGVVFRHPEKGMSIGIHWPSYLQIAKARIAIRMKERRLQDAR